MIAEIEATTVMIRVFGDHHRWGDRYIYSVAGIRVDRGVLEFCGALRAPKPSEWRAIRAQLVHHGYTEVRWKRSDGRVSTFDVTTWRRISQKEDRKKTGVAGWLLATPKSDYLYCCCHDTAERPRMQDESSIAKGTWTYTQQYGRVL